MSEAAEEKEKKQEKKKTACKKHKRACKIGGLWVDAKCFPKLTEEEKDPSENR